MEALPQAADRRAAPRAPWYGQALLHIQQRRLGCTVVDVSASGLLVVPPARAAKGASLLIDLMLPPQLAPVRLSAVVAREGNVHGHYAWGLQFVDPPVDVQTVISAFVSTTRRRLGAEQAARAGAPSAERAPVSAPYSQVRGPQFRSDPAARVGSPGQPGRYSAAHAGGASASAPGAAARDGSAGSASSGTSARSSSSGTYRRVFATPVSTPVPPSRPGASASSEAIPQLAGITTTAAQPRTQAQRPYPEATPNLGVRVAPRSSSTTAASPTQQRPPLTSAATRRSSMSPTASQRAAARETKDWDENAHCTPLEVRELYQAALSDISGQRKPRKP
ncbi:MAG: PilZ domain-containing protein [Proteobacteria bacterium]|nr:PilZ domain-containing protein [Pseudomonadota bacterium]